MCQGRTRAWGGCPPHWPTAAPMFCRPREKTWCAQRSEAKNTPLRPSQRGANGPRSMASARNSPKMCRVASWNGGHPLPQLWGGAADPGHWVETTRARVHLSRQTTGLGHCWSHSAVEKLGDGTPRPWIPAPAKQNNTQTRSKGRRNPPKIDAAGQGLGDAVSTKYEREGNNDLAAIQTFGDYKTTMKEETD